MIKTSDRTDLPDWVRNNIMMDCPYCGASLYDNSDTGVTTARKCLNPMCPGHMQYKIVELAKYFNIKGIGPATALEWIRCNNPKTHLDALKVWFPNDKPKVSLSDVAVLAYLEGYGVTKANNQLNSYGSFEDYFNRCTDPDPILVKYRIQLMFCEKYFDIKQPLSEQKIYVMVTGTFNGYMNRDDLIRELNDKYGQYVQVVNVGKRKTGVHFLIKEEGAVDHSKSQIAREYNIPIISPNGFKYVVEQVATQFGYVNTEAFEDTINMEGGYVIEDL